jgi:ketosteroid isomerase-like protein
MDPLDVLAQQVAAWNRGDLATFCSFYADDAVYLSAIGIDRDVRAGYAARYPDGAVGTLSVSIDDVRELGPSASIALRWSLDGGRAEGGALLVLHRGPDGWRIVQDATWSAP